MNFNKLNLFKYVIKLLKLYNPYNKIFTKFT